MVADAFAPVLAVSSQSDTSLNGTVGLLFGSGRNLDRVCWDNDCNRYVFCWRSEVFTQRGSNIYGIIPSQQDGDSIIVYGEKSMAFVRANEPRVSDSRIVTFDDWIQTATLLDDGSLAVLFACNTIVVYRIIECMANDSMNLDEQKRIRSSHKSVLLYSLLDGRTWDELCAIVGTIFGDILLWYPSKGPHVTKRLTGHTGMIFGLLLKDSCHLFSISDDRTLRMWSMKSFTQLNEAYGHSARPFAICDAPEGRVITGGQDGTVCVWNTSDHVLSLMHRIRIGRGAIRTLLFHRNNIVLGTNGGLKCAIRMSPNLSSLHPISRFIHKTPIRSFIRISSASSFILDSDGVLSLVRNAIAEKVVKCVSIRYDSLILCPSGRFVTFSSWHTVFVVPVECATRFISLDFPERITSALWVGERLIVACESGSLVICEISKPLELLQKRTLLLAHKDIPNAAVEYGARIFVGTRKGRVIVVENDKCIAARQDSCVLKVIDVKLRCHGNESITDLIVYQSKLLSIGRDGKLARWLIDSTQDGKLTLLRKRTPSFWIDMEWPCKFINGFEGALWIAGFHGTNFVLLDYETGHGLCEVNCGGGHRIWQFTIKDFHSGSDVSMSTSYAQLNFICNGDLIQMDINLSTIDIISQNAHTSEMSAVCVFNEALNGDLLVTAGIDTQLVVSRIALAGYFPVLFRTSAHTSSVYALSVLDDFLISAGGKSQLFLWRYQNGELMQLFALRLMGDARLVSVKLAQTSPYFAFVVAASDSRLEWYRLKEDLSGIETCISLMSTLGGAHLMTTKVTTTPFKNTFSVYATSTSGTLTIWMDVEKPTKFEVFEVEKAGLSALDVLKRINYIVVAVGSESGRLNVASVCLAEKTKFCHIDWHGATCTALCIRLTELEHVVHIISIALDCRIALFLFSSISQTIEFRHAVLLNVADPSSLCFISRNEGSETDIAIVGSSLQIVSFDDLSQSKQC